MPTDLRERSIIMKTSEAIIVTQDTLKDITFDNVSFDIKKTSTIDGKKVEWTYKVCWNGGLGETALKQASMHQAKNRYNNTRPIFDEDGKVQTAEEYAVRKANFLALNVGIEVVEAVAETARAFKEKVITKLKMLQSAKQYKDAGDQEKFDFWYNK